jgi:asparagine synthase (glutamine-hydrolysing)
MASGRRPSRPQEAYDKLLRLLELETPEAIYDYLTRYFPSSISLQQNEYHGALVKISDLNEQIEFILKVSTLDLATYLPDDLLAKIDRATMACSLEGRSPLLDYRLVEFALSLPASLKIKNGEKKYFLKKLLERNLPRELFDRPKVGFSLPIGDWLKGELKTWAEERLHYLQSNLSEMIDMPQVWEKWSEHQAGKKYFPNEIWTAVIFSQWHERWIKA